MRKLKQRKVQKISVRVRKQTRPRVRQGIDNDPDGQHLEDHGEDADEAAMTRLPKIGCEVWSLGCARALRARPARNKQRRWPSVPLRRARLG